MISGIAQRLAQPVHGGTDAVLELHNGVIRPQRLADFFAAHHLAGTLQQHGEDAKRLFGQTNLFGPVLAQLTGAKVEFKCFETDQSLEVLTATWHLAVLKSVPFGWRYPWALFFHAEPVDVVVL